jgi:hypothetical protein
MPPTDRPIPQFFAEPPREQLPYGRWAEALGEHFLAAASALDTEDDLGEPGPLTWFPDRTLWGRTYIPATAPTSNGFELYGVVSFTREHEGAEAREFAAYVDYTDETAEANPDWELDLSDHELGPWRGPRGRTSQIALVWGVALVQNGAVATAELGPTTTDQCVLADDRFTLVSLDSYGGDFIEVKLFGGGGTEIASESLFEED